MLVFQGQNKMLNHKFISELKKDQFKCKIMI